MDRIKFAQLIAYLSRLSGHNFDSYEIREIDRMIGDNLADGTVVAGLLAAMASGRKIDAIKDFRTLTGHGLKESKDAVESVMDRFVRVAA